MIRIAIFSALVVGLFSTHLQADILPAGHKSISHQLVFEQSDELENHRIIAAPIAGFSGHVEIEPGEPFNFSSKYGTRFYVVPDSVKEIPKFDRDVFGEWANALPPRSQIKSVPLTSPLNSALTTVKLNSIGEEGPEVELIKHQEFNRAGREISALEKTAVNSIYLGLPVVAGLGLCTFVYLRRRSQSESKASAG